MEKISLPTKINIADQGDNRGMVTIEPCYPGYGTTVGNALRRVLLASLPGASVVAFKVKGVQHEFSTIGGIKEDVVEIMMNLKQLCLKVHSGERVELLLKVKGEKEVKASDIGKNADVEIINKDLTICNITNKGTELEMKIWVEQGLGYLPVEEKKGDKPEIGVIQVDAVYTPIQKVGLTRENIRVGERTDYDKLTLDIETDGTITVKDAICQAAEILVEQFGYVATFGELGKSVDEEAVSDDKDEDKEIRNEKEEKKDDDTAEIKDDGEMVEGEEADEVEEAAPVKPKKRGRPKKT